MSCYVDGVFSDKIDQSISAKQSEQRVIICALCGSVYQKSKIKCDTCKVNLHASQKRNLPDVQVNTGKSKTSRVHEKEKFSMYRQPILNKLYHITAKGHTYRPWIHCRSILIPMTVSN